MLNLNNLSFLFTCLHLCFSRSIHLFSSSRPSEVAQIEIASIIAGDIRVLWTHGSALNSLCVSSSELAFSCERRGRYPFLIGSSKLFLFHHQLLLLHQFGFLLISQLALITNLALIINDLQAILVILLAQLLQFLLVLALFNIDVSLKLLLELV